jgi:hypothetical protein
MQSVRHRGQCAVEKQVLNTGMIVTSTPEQLTNIHQARPFRVIIMSADCEDRLTGSRT